jgi:hypothetical protein
VDTHDVFRAPAYDDRYVEVYREIVDALIAEDPVLGEIKSEFSRHIGPRRNVRGAEPLDQPSMVISANSQLAVSDVLNTNIEAHDEMLYMTAQEVIEHRTKDFFSRVSQITDAVGTSVTGGGAPTLEQFRELLERMDLAFDEDGSLSKNLRLYVGPSNADKARELMEAAANDDAIREIIAKKRKAWMEKRAQKRNRKLS